MTRLVKAEVLCSSVSLVLQNLLSTVDHLCPCYLDVVASDLLCLEVCRLRVFERTRGLDFEIFDASYLGRHTCLSQHLHVIFPFRSLDLQGPAPFSAFVDASPPRSRRRAIETGEVYAPPSPIVTT